jgi:hypothetical protein
MQLTAKPYKTSLTADDIVSIRIARKLGLGVRCIARITGKPQATICKITTEFHHVSVYSETLSIFEDAL